MNMVEVHESIIKLYLHRFSAKLVENYGVGYVRVHVSTFFLLHATADDFSCTTVAERKYLCVSLFYSEDTFFIALLYRLNLSVQSDINSSSDAIIIFEASTVHERRVVRTLYSATSFSLFAMIVKIIFL